MNDLQHRKKLLLAESEVYREMLKLELRTFRLYGMRAKRRIKSISTYTPLVIEGLPLFRALFGGRKRLSTWKRVGSLVYFGWQSYRRFGPLLQDMLRQRAGPRKTAAEEYLSKRI